MRRTIPRVGQTLLAGAALVMLLFTLSMSAPSRGLSTDVSPLPTNTSTPCPSATPELLAVEPLTSPTRLLSQVVTVRIGNGEAVTVTAESGAFTVTGSFGASFNPALVDVDLLANATHHLSVNARVRIVNSGGCQYGGYTLSTTQDKFGAPLAIVQVSNDLLLPIVLKNAP